MQARSGEGPWETFFLHPLRGPIFRRHLDGEWDTAGDYPHWVRCYDQLQREDLQRIREQIARFDYSPLISVLLPVYNSNLKWLRRAVLSVQKQLYPRWELCIVDDASTNRKIWPFLAEMRASRPRIKLMRRTENGHISAASNDALRLATGDFVALLDHDDELAPTALYFVALALNKNRDLQLLYSDEDKLDEHNRRLEPYFKSDWNPELFLAQNFILHLGVYGTDLLRRVGGFRIGFEGSQDYDLALRCIEQIQPKEINICRGCFIIGAQEIKARPRASRPNHMRKKPLAAPCRNISIASGIAGTVVPSHGIYLQTKYALPPEQPMVSIVIPTRDKHRLSGNVWRASSDKTDYRTFEVIVLDNESYDPETLEFLAALKKRERVRVERIEDAVQL